MKARRLKALGFALLGSLALLFAGCGQQAGGGTGGTGNGAVTSVGIQLPPPPAGGYNGVISVDVTVNEGAQVKSVVLKVDGQQVNQINVAGLRPQSINYTLLLDTAQLDPATKQPRFRNGTHTLTVEVTDANNNTKSASATVIFRNQDYVRGVEVSQTDNPKAPVTKGNTQWYGNGDVFVTVDIVNYSGATYSLSGSGSPFDLQASGGQGGSLSGYKVELMNANPTLVSGQPQLKLAKSNNSGVETNNVTAKVKDNATPTPNEVASKTFGLDNKAPTTGTLKVQYRRIVLDYNFGDLSATTTTGTSQTLFRGTGANDSGVEGVTYQVAFKVGTNTVATATLPNEPSPGVTVSGLSNFATYDVEVTAVEDALGNKATVSSFTAVKFQLTDAPITLSSVNVSDTTPAAGTTFTVSYSVSASASGYGTLSARVALKLGGNKLLFFSGPVTGASGTLSVAALFGAQYVLYVVDSAGNFAVANLPVTVSQSASDNTPPTITVSLPSSVAPTGSINISGTYSDPNPPSSPTVDVYLSHGSLGGFEWYASLPTSPGVTTSGTYSLSPTTTPPAPNAPNYTGSLGVVVLGRDNFNNLGSATGTVNVQP
jgi:hypothetical protein